MHSKNHKHKKRIIAEPLEPRLLFSASADMVLLDDVLPDLDLGTQAAEVDLLDIFDLPSAEHDLIDPDIAADLPPPAREEFAGEIIVVDGSLNENQALIEDIQANSPDKAFEIFTLDPERDGIEQISLLLANYSGVKSVHLLSHGGEARLKLGNTRLDEQTVEDRSDELASWKDALSDDADLMIYGCNVAANDAGTELLNRIAQITDADVAASNDDTGTQILGGDWQLEHQVGAIETEALAAPSWNGLMAATAIDDSITIWFDETLQGNVLTGVGGSGINADSFDTGPGILLSVTYNGVVYNAFDGSGNLTINADQGTVVFNQDGTYTYTTSFSATTVSGDTNPSWSTVFDLYGYSAGTSYLNGSSLLDTSLSDTDVFEEFNGLGIIGGDSYELDNTDGTSEAVVVDTLAEYGQAKITTSALSATETLQWEAYASTGTLVGSGTLNGVAGGGAADYQTQVIDVASDFQYLVFTVPNAGEALYIHEISLGDNIPADEVFSYVVDDAGTGGTDTGLLTISFADDNLGQASSFVNGVFDEGETLITDFIIAEPDGVSGTINYQWQRSVDGEHWIAITGETSDSYTLTSADAGYFVGVEYSYFDDEGTLETFDSQYSPPRIDSADGSGRLLITGNEAEGQLLNAIVHDPDGANGTIDYQWQRSSDGLSWSDIAGATAADYTLTSADLSQYVRATANYVDDGGNPENLTSPSSGLIGNNDIGVISVSGTFTENETLSSSISDADGVSGLVSYQWQRSDDGSTWSDITGAIASSYTLVGADVNNYVRVSATYVDGGGHTELPVSATASLVTSVNDGSGITLSGVEAENEILTATINDPDAGTPTAITYAWERSTDSGTTWSSITGATSDTYTLTDQDSNNLVRVVADYTDGEGNLETNVIDTSGIIASVNDGNGITLSGIETENETLTTSINDPDAGIPTAITYVWERSTDGGATWSSITGATSSFYTLTDQDANNLVRVVADYTDGEGNLETNVIDTSGIIASVNDGSGITLSGIEAENEILTATINDPDAGTPSAITYTWQRSTDGGTTWSSITGASSDTYTLTDQDANNIVRVVADYTDGEGNLETNVIDTSGIIASFNDGNGITLSGIEAENEILTATINDPDAGSPTAITYAWERSTDGGTTWSSITGASGATYTLTDQDTNNIVRVVADYTDGEGNLETNVIDTSGIIASFNDGNGITLSGVEAENEVLTATINDPDAGTPSAITYTWQRSTDGGTTWSTITGATSATYTLTDQDSNNLVRVVADYTDGEGNLESNVIDTSGIIASFNDGNGITLSGIEAENEILTATINDPDAGTPTAITYVWERSTDGGATWSTITGATNATYTLTDQDSTNLVRVLADYTDGEGNLETNVIDTSGIIASANDGSGITLSGIEAENEILTATITDPDAGTPTAIAYVWERSTDGGTTWSAITGATGATYTLTDQDANNLVRVVADYTDGEGNLETNVIDTSGIIASVNDGSGVTLSGVEAENEILTATITDPDAGTATAITYVWERSTDGGTTWSAITGATGASYTLTDQDSNNLVRVVADYTDGEGNLETNVIDTSGIIASFNDGNGITLSGIEAENEVLTATINDPDAGTPTAITYVWERSTDGGTTWSTITGETNATYTLTDQDSNNFVRVVADYTDGEGNAETNVTATSGVITPVNDSSSLTLSGTAEEDQSLSTTLVDTDGVSGTVTYTWQRSADGVSGWSDIAGATTASYTLVDADVGQYLRAIADYTDDQGFAEIVSSASSAQVNGINDPGAVALTGTAAEDQTLSANVTDIDGISGTINYSWQRSADGTTGWTTIATATNASYTLDDIDTGTYLRVQVNYTDDQGFAEALTSAASGPVSASNDPASLSLSGTAAENASLTANLSDADGISGSVTYTWQRSVDGLTWNTITGSTSASYTLTNSDTGSFIRVTADYTDDQGFIESVTSASSAQVAAENDTGTLSLTGIAAEDEILTANVSDADGISSPITYTWERSGDGNNNWNTVATGESYTLGDADVDSYLRVVARYTDDQNFNETLTSSVSGPVSAVNDAPTLTISGNNEQNQTLTANLNDADGFDAGSVLYQWERSSNGVDWQIISGANSATYTLAQADVDNSLRLSVSYTDNQGFSENPSVSVGPISDVNDAPELQIVVLDQLATEDQRFEFSLDSNTFTDPDGDPLSYRAQLLGGGALPAWLSFDATALQFTGTASRDDVGTVSIEVIAEDDRGGQASTSFDLTVNGINDRPTSTGLADIRVDEDAPTSVVDLIANFNDEESGAQNLRFSVEGNNNPGLFSQVEIDSDGSLYLSYAQDQWGTAVITLRATDEAGAFVESPLSIFVSPVNDQPTTSGFDSIQFVNGEREQSQIDLSAGFNDVEDGRDLSYSVIDNSNADLVTVAAVDDSGRLILNYSAPGSGNANIVLRATDSDGAFVETTLLVQITPQPITELPQQPETPEPEEPETEPETPVESSDDPEDESTATDAPANSSDDLVRSNGDGTASNNDYREFLTLAENTRSRPVEYDAPISYANARHESPAKVREARDDIGGEPIDNREIASLAALPGGYLSEQDISDFNEELHKLKIAMDEVIEEQESSNAIYQGLTISLTTGLAVWVLRASSLFLTLFSMIPIWRGLDPMPVVHAQVRRLEKIRQQKDKQEEDKQAKEVGYLFDKEAS